MYRKLRRDGIRGVPEKSWLHRWLQRNRFQIFRAPMINCVGYIAVIF